MLCVLFAVFAAGFGLAETIAPDRLVSSAERRRLRQKPEFTVQSLLSGEYAERSEEYLADQFPLRQELRGVKALWEFKALGKKDSDGVYLSGGSVCAVPNALDEGQINALVNKVNAVNELYLGGLNVYFAAVPDKAGYAPVRGMQSFDYAAADALLRAGLAGGIRYLGFDPCGGLGLEDYYKTDIHWRQEKLQSVVDALGAAMDFRPGDVAGYEGHTFTPFYGAYAGQAALGGSDDIVCLRPAGAENAVVTGLDFDGEKPMYDEADFAHLDGYDVFLGGPQTVVTVENPAGKTGRELYIFRDSFASSLAPLLLSGYDRITLIDLRYISAQLVGDYVRFTPGADALFLYSTEVLNRGRLLK